jgi:hypothetical protein
LWYLYVLEARLRREREELSGRSVLEGSPSHS